MPSKKIIFNFNINMGRESDISCIDWFFLFDKNALHPIFTIYSFMYISLNPKKICHYN